MGAVMRALAAAATAFTIVSITACSPSESESPAASDPATALSREPAPGFERVTEPRPFVFPEDHGPHPETQTEWWYVTGNLASADGHEFGYQFTVFRLGVVPPSDSARIAQQTGSAWAGGSMYMAHLAVSDLTDASFTAEQRLARSAVGLAGAQAQPFRVWLEGWSLEAVDPDEFFPLTLNASAIDGDDRVDLTLELAAGKPMVLQGDRGYSRKGEGDGDASYYFSFTRMPTTGEVTINGRTTTVTGDSWLDREWSTSVLSRTQRGWDWFAIQLDDGRDVMMFELRDEDPALTVRDGTLVQPDGSTTRLEPEAGVLEVLDTWTSPVDGAEYPSRWRLRLPEHDLDLEIESALGDQEHTSLFRYWEGAVVARTPDGARVGKGYAELTGYATGR